MNSEELELSLRTEFESYLKGVLAGIRRDVSDFQKNFETEFEKHKSQLDESIRSLATRFESEPEFDRAFSESVIEHLRLARDEGATITANAIGAAEKLKDEGAETVSYDLIRDAIKDITSRRSQSAILKSLVEQAGQFAPRGAFFIVKHEHFVGWKAFGKEGGLDDATVQGVHFPISADTVFSAATRSLSVREVVMGDHVEDNLFLEPLGFGRPDRMYAIPLMARGRGVAVMYADYGTMGVRLNADALETLVRVAGLTVELLAASNDARPLAESYAGDESAVRAAAERETYTAPTSAAQPVEPEPAEYAGEVSYDDAAAQEAAAEVSTPKEQVETEPEPEVEVEEITYFEAEVAPEPTHFSESQPAAENRQSSFENVVDHPAPKVDEWKTEVPVSATVPVEEYVANGNGVATVGAGEPAAEVAATQVRARTGDRNVDLPIEVSEDERRDHSNARRFARLLVSEIKLYNEQKVAEGRESNDLYDRLREAIDRSREMYEKRVQPEVAAKFDYFHYELVNGLADGSDERLGHSYPGAAA